MNIDLRSILLDIHVITNKCSTLSVCFKPVGTCSPVSLARYEKCTSKLEGNYEVSNCTNLNRVCNNKHCKYHRVVLSSFGQTNQLTISLPIGL